MRYLGLSLVTLLSLFVTNAFSATCSSITRSNISANSVLTSTEYNGSLNTAYSAINSLDLGCSVAGSLDDVATLNSTTFNALLNGIKEGCVVTNTDSNTISVDKCMMAVNGNFVKTTSATTVTWGCTSCSSETATTIYYVYVKTGSSGSTLNLLISTTAPNADGYDGSGNRVLAQFTNNFSSNIEAVLNVRRGNQFDDNWFSDITVTGANMNLTTATVASNTAIANGSLTASTLTGSVESRIVCSSTNPPTGSTCGAGNEELGTSFIMPKVGRVLACADWNWHYTTNTNGVVTPAFVLASTPINSDTSLSETGNAVTANRGTESADNLIPDSNCAILNYATAGQKAIRLFYVQSVGTSVIASTVDADNVLGKNFHIRVRPLPDL